MKNCSRHADLFVRLFARAIISEVPPTLSMKILTLYHNFLSDYCRDFSNILHICTRSQVDSQCFRLRTNVRKFTPKSSDLRTYYLPGGQPDAEVFVERNIDISSIYEAILYLFQFRNKNGRFPAVYLSLRMRGIKRSRGEEFARLRGHACALGLFSYKIQRTQDFLLKT